MFIFLSYFPSACFSILNLFPPLLLIQGFIQDFLLGERGDHLGDLLKHHRWASGMPNRNHDL